MAHEKTTHYKNKSNKLHEHKLKINNIKYMLRVSFNLWVYINSDGKNEKREKSQTLDRSHTSTFSY